MLKDNHAIVRWNSKNKKRFVDLGYEFTKMRDPFEVDVKDLSDGSNATVFLICDYCGKEYTTAWYTYLYIHRRSDVDKDCCGDCCQLKAKEAVQEKYGDFSGMFYAANDRRAATNIERYGTANVFASECIKERIVASNMEKYGVPYTQQNKDVHAKGEETCLKKYGVRNYFELFRGKFIKENSPNWKGGPEYSRVERATYEYIQWRKAVYHRDNCTCQCCGRRSHKGATLTLNAHHIANWKDNEDLRYDVDNGVTLCSECHTAFHQIYGKRHNTREQLDEFISNQINRYAELAGTEPQELQDKKPVG